MLTNIQSAASGALSSLICVLGQAPPSPDFGNLLTAAGDAASAGGNVSSDTASTETSVAPTASPTQIPVKKKEDHSKEHQLPPPLLPNPLSNPVLAVPTKAPPVLLAFEIGYLKDEVACVATSDAARPLPQSLDDRTTQTIWAIQPSSAAPTPGLPHAISQDSPKTDNGAETHQTTSPKATTHDLADPDADSIQKTPLPPPLGDFQRQQTPPEVGPSVSPQTEMQTAAKLAAVIPPAVVPSQTLEGAADTPPQTGDVSPTDSPIPQSNAQTATQLAAVLSLPETPAPIPGGVPGSLAQPTLPSVGLRQAPAGTQPSHLMHATNSAWVQSDNAGDSKSVSSDIQFAFISSSNETAAVRQFTTSIGSTKPDAVGTEQGSNNASHILKTDAQTDLPPAPSRKSNNITQDAQKASQNPQSAVAHASTEHQPTGVVPSSDGNSLPAPAITNIATHPVQTPTQPSSQPLTQKAQPNSGQSEPAAKISATQPVQVHAARIIQSGSQSEMRMEMRTQAFGGVEIHATVSGKDVQLSIGADRGDLRTSLAPELPALQNALQQLDLRLEHVRTLSPGNQAQPDFSSGSNRQEQRFQRSTPPSPGSYEPEHFEDDDRLGEPMTRLSVRA